VSVKNTVHDLDPVSGLYSAGLYDGYGGYGGYGVGAVGVP